jgi:hypothetical protein
MNIGICQTLGFAILKMSLQVFKVYRAVQYNNVEFLTNVISS